MGEKQACGPPEERGDPGLNLHSRTGHEAAEGPGGSGGAAEPPPGQGSQETPAEAALCHKEAPGISGDGPGRAGPSGHPSDQTPERRSPLAVQHPGPDIPLEYLPSLSECFELRGRLVLGVYVARFPFPVRAIQIDGGSEFKEHFENACRERGIRLFIIPPRAPKLQGYVERANRTHREEFYEVEDIGLKLEDHNWQLKERDKTCDYVRPHQSLDYLTPAEYYQGWLKLILSRACHYCSGPVHKLDIRF
jgi:hypothetical protein